mmetsp:Transcript_4807/g.13378  ORF Transcript_4807/g.13378 Transcript_4807/m.13378 type:complete len:637 (-) Transcript_4807:94-2004(-)
MYRHTCTNRYKVVVVSTYNNGNAPNILRFASRDCQVFHWQALACHGEASSQPLSPSSSAAPPPQLQLPEHAARTASPPAPPQAPPPTRDTPVATPIPARPLPVVPSARPQAPAPTRDTPMATPIPVGPLPAPHSHRTSANGSKVSTDSFPSAPAPCPSRPTASPLLPRMHPRCSEAVKGFWETNPNGSPVQHPYEGFVSFLTRRCGGYKTFGYSKLQYFLKDAQAAGLLWLRPGQVMDQVSGASFPEIAPASRSCLHNTNHILYWLALGFSQEEAEAYRKLAAEKRWSHEVVGKLARPSPGFDPDLHARWYLDLMGSKAWAVRNQAKQASSSSAATLRAGITPSSSSSVTSTSSFRRESEDRSTRAAAPSSAPLPQPPPSLTVPSLKATARGQRGDLPPGCVAAVSDYWEAHPSCSSVLHPYQDFVAFLSSHPECGGHKACGYKKLSHFLSAAQSAGIIWLREVAGSPYPEIARAEKKNLLNPCHVLYWQALGFSPKEATVCVSKVGIRDWSDAVVGKLARNSPEFDNEFHSRLMYSGSSAATGAAGLEAHEVDFSDSSSISESFISAGCSDNGSGDGALQGDHCYSKGFLMTLKDQCTAAPPQLKAALLQLPPDAIAWMIDGELRFDLLELLLAA